MKGTVHKINQNRGLVAVETEQGYSIFENLSGSDIKVGDMVEWYPDTILGSSNVSNHASKKELDVYFEGHHIPADKLNMHMGMK